MSDGERVCVREREGLFVFTCHFFYSECHYEIGVMIRERLGEKERELGGA